MEKIQLIIEESGNLAGETWESYQNWFQTRWTKKCRASMVLQQRLCTNRSTAIHARSSKMPCETLDQTPGSLRISLRCYEVMESSALGSPRLQVSLSWFRIMKNFVSLTQVTRYYDTWLYGTWGFWDGGWMTGSWFCAHTQCLCVQLRGPARMISLTSCQWGCLVVKLFIEVLSNGEGSSYFQGKSRIRW